MQFPLKGPGLEQKSSRACSGVLKPLLKGPEGTRRKKLHSPWRNLLHPDIMCLTKARKENKIQSLD
jgi:hypothetical protein